MIQITSPVAARAKWPRMRGGRMMPLPAVWRMPPPCSQRPSMTKPPPAVTTQVISAAHSIASPPLSLLTSLALLTLGRLEAARPVDEDQAAAQPAPERQHAEPGQREDEAARGHVAVRVARVLAPRRQREEGDRRQ